jgi:hypothetical protein
MVPISKLVVRKSTKPTLLNVTNTLKGKDREKKMYFSGGGGIPVSFNLV